MEGLKTTVSKRGQTVIPAELRKQYGISPGDTLAWIDTGTSLQVMPLPEDPIAALRGSGAGEGLLARLLDEREADRALESGGT
jgi:AbrB family looped-hinge helix DNA binding protein